MSEEAETRDSSAVSRDSFLTVARVVRAHGTAGELACEIVTEFPQRFRGTRTLHLARPGRSAESPREHRVERARTAPRSGGAQLLLKLAGIDDRQSAEGLRGALVQVPEREAWKLPKGRFYRHHVIGLRAVTVDGSPLGQVADILETGANDVYVIRGDGGERLLPAIKDVVKEIAPERGEMVVELLPGL